MHVITTATSLSSLHRMILLHLVCWALNSEAVWLPTICSVTHFWSEEWVNTTASLAFPSSSVCTWTTLVCWRAKPIAVCFLTCSSLAVCRRPWASCVFAGTDSHFWSTRSLFTYRMISLRLLMGKSACRLLRSLHCIWHPPLVDFYPSQGRLVPQM